VLRTRGTNANILRGVTRISVIDLAREMGLKVEERPFTPAEAHQAQEAFITAASLPLLPVTMVDGEPVGTGLVGPMATELRRIYLERARAAAI